MSPNFHQKRTAIRAAVVDRLRQLARFNRVDEYLRTNIDEQDLPSAQVYFDSGNINSSRLSANCELLVTIIGPQAMTDKVLDDIAAQVATTLDASPTLDGNAEAFMLTRFHYERSPEVPLASLTLTYHTIIEA